MTAQFHVYGLPATHSASPAFQQAALDALGIAATYTAIDVDADALRACADAVRDGSVAGANITAPHKQLALELADVVSIQAAEIGAANVWVRSPEGLLVADNTDWIGLEAALVAVLPKGFSRAHAVLLGAGGAARAAAFVLSRIFERVTIVAREPARAKELAVEVVFSDAAGDAIFAAHRWPRSPYTRRRTAELFGDVSLVVNAASVTPEAAAFAWMPFKHLSASARLLDLAYARGTTPFVAAAQAAGRTAADGAVMLLHQGAAAFHRFAAQPAPLEVMRDALACELGRPPAAIAMAPGPLRRDPFAQLGQIVPATPSDTDSPQ